MGLYVLVLFCFIYLIFFFSSLVMVLPLQCINCFFVSVIKMEHSVERILNAKTVTAASPMAPACGLYLGHVKYDLP